LCQFPRLYPTLIANKNSRKSQKPKLLYQSIQNTQQKQQQQFGHNLHFFLNWKNRVSYLSFRIFADCRKVYCYGSKVFVDKKKLTTALSNKSRLHCYSCIIPNLSFPFTLFSFQLFFLFVYLYFMQISIHNIFWWDTNKRKTTKNCCTSVP
jgi:hypothetical protein